MSYPARRTCALIACLVLPSLSWAETAPTPPTPAQVAQKAVEDIKQIADRTVAANKQQADTAIERIKALLAAGKPGAAHAVGHAAIEAIKSRTQEAVQLINRRTEDALRLIKRLGGGEDLLKRVRDAAAFQRSRVLQSGQRTIGAILTALGIEPNAGGGTE